MHRSILSLLALVLLTGPIHGLTIGGRLTSSLYTFESQQADTATHARAHQSLRLDLGRLLLPALSMHLYVRGSTDLAEQAETDPRLRIYHAYLAWRKEQYRLQIGRQRIYAGAGYGSIDGLRGDLRMAGCDVVLYAGSLVPWGKGSEITSWDDGHLWGAKVGTDRFFGTALSLSFAHRERRAEAYSDTGRYSGLLLHPQAVTRSLASLDLSRRFEGGHSLYGRIDYDFDYEEIRRVEMSGWYVLSPRASLQLEWFRRSPSVFYHSIFSVFPRKDYQEIGGRLYYRIRPNLQLSFHFADLLYDGDDAQRFGLVAGIGSYYQIGYYRTVGYARGSDGLVGSLHYPVGRKFVFQGKLDLTSYERYSDDDRDGLVSGMLGLTFRPTRRTSFQVQVQGLRNPDYSSDLRLFLRGSWRFFKRER